MVGRCQWCHPTCLDNAYPILSTRHRLAVIVKPQDCPALHLPSHLQAVSEVCPLPPFQTQGHLGEPGQLQTLASFLYQELMQRPSESMHALWCGRRCPQAVTRFLSCKVYKQIGCWRHSFRGKKTLPSWMTATLPERPVLPWPVCGAMVSAFVNQSSWLWPLFTLGSQTKATRGPSAAAESGVMQKVQKSWLPRAAP